MTNVANGAGGLNLSCTTNKSKSWTIQDWGVENKGFGDDLHWLFSAAVAP